MPAPAIHQALRLGRRSIAAAVVGAGVVGAGVVSLVFSVLVMTSRCQPGAEVSLKQAEAGFSGA
jgi:hypothetical protein